jgi:acyl-CoA synthetase (AMP-forming)/AMP-acid ligase II
MLEAGGLWDLVEKRAVATPDALFAVDERGRQLDFAGYRDAVLRTAAGLYGRGIREGDRVSWQLPTTLEAMILAAALARLGAVQNPILPIYRAREVGFVTRQSQAKLLCVPGTFRGFDYAAMARAIAAEQTALDVLVVEDALPGRSEPDLPPAPPDTTPADTPVRWLFYTSGTTADPKGARHTDHTLMAAARGMCQRLALRPDDRIALVFPFTHVGGVLWLMNGLKTGAAQIVVAVFDPKTTIPLLARHGVTQATAGTVFHQAYLAAQREHGAAPLFPNVRSFPGGGAPKPPQLHLEIKREMGGAGIVSGYGLTECPALAMNDVNDPDEKLAETEGRATPEGTTIKIVDFEGNPAGAGQEGELRVQAPQLCMGYLDESLNQEAFDEEGFFRTGDLGYQDADGFVVITGRLKDVIIRKGENISAKEVEDLLYRHPKVRDAAVIGLPDPKSGERACAVVACEDLADPLALDEMVDFLAEQGLMVQKLPEQLELVDEVPRNPTGKILKHELRKRYGQ